MLVLHGLFIGSQTMWVTLDVLLHIVILPENKKRIHQIFKEITLTHSVQFSSVTQSCPTLWPHESQHARLPCPSPFRSLLKPMSIESVMPSSHLILCHPLLLLPPILCPQSFDTLVFFIQILEISEFSCWHHILAIYCHITNCPETTWLKTAISFW